MGGSRSICASFDRRLYAGMSALALGVVLVGFSRSYYLKALFGAPSLPLLLHLHGSVMTLWFVLYVVQAALIRAGRADLHRVLGVAGAALALVLVPLGLATARQFVIRSLDDPDVLPIAAAVAGFDAVVLGVFVILVATALIWRRRTDIHKRLMTLAALSLLGPPLARLVDDDVVAVIACLLMVLVPVAIDTLVQRRLHPAFGWGAALVVLSNGAALVMIAKPAWTEFVAQLVE